ncbi:Ger(x)C family spore germination protein [Paenibacillus soyae]|uniref:Ger(X)C family spore germination protein n=1 Tax=Paenibacillus soyae TaxID=2969249 RepID=A0A9X2SAW2_9BACL|nr:Ger(x)C family spore germination protein [Paenibacillus soyae]MCR2807109.1 Ger(x)C family spore germination protein [Paenibacillus soyae]
MKLPNRFGRLLLALALLLVATGCWDRHELNNLAIISAIGFDKHGDKIRVTVQVLDPDEVAGTTGGGAGKAPVITYEEEGITVDDAFGRLTTKAPYPLYLSHVRMVVFGETLARGGIAKVLDFLSRDRQMRTDFYLVVAKKRTAREVLGIFTQIEKIPGNKLYSSLRTASQEWAPVQETLLIDVINDLVNKGKQLVLTGVQIEGDEKAGGTPKNNENIRSIARLSFNGIAVFKSDKLIGWLTENESKGYSYIRDKVKRTIGNVACGQEKYVSLKVIRSETKQSVRMEGGEPIVRLRVEIEADVNESTCDIDLEKDEAIAELEEESARKLNQLIDSSINRAKRMKSDIFGFGDLLERNEPGYWRAHQDQWQTLFPELEVETEIVYRIRRIGTRTNSLLKEMEE